MMNPTPFHIIVESNPAILYASRGGTPDKILPVLQRFLDKFWKERETFGETIDTPECLLAQITVRFGFEICEDDFSNLRLGIKYNPAAEYLYWVGLNGSLQVWKTEAAYRQEPAIGTAGCSAFVPEYNIGQNA
jgi:hypothetical protein